MTATDHPLRIRQYVYFALKSETMPAAAITAHLDVEPDCVGVRGARRSVPPVPVCHSWTIECRQPGLAVDEQAAQVLSRIRPIADAIRALTVSGEVSAVLQVVRDFDNDQGEPGNYDPVTTDDGRVLQRLAGQHHLLGWHLTGDDLALLASVAATLDVDEYG